MCRHCGSIISCYLNKEILKKKVVVNEKSTTGGSQHYNVNQNIYCRVCDKYDCKKIAIPYVLRYMTNELAAMNIKMKFELDSDLVRETVVAK